MVERSSIVRPHIVKPKSGSEKRLGRGFSLREIVEAGLTLSQAFKLKIPIDRRRGSAHEWNIEAIKKLLAATPSAVVKEPTPPTEVPVVTLEENQTKGKAQRPRRRRKPSPEKKVTEPEG